jgi:hypothetical protein
MVTVNRDPEPSRVPTGWDPYEVWYVRVRSATLQLAQRQRAGRLLSPAMHSSLLHLDGTWTWSKAVFVRVLQTASRLCV